MYKTLPIAALIALAACNNNGTGEDDFATIDGQVSEQSGSQARFAGSGSAAAATQVEVISTASDNAVVATGEVDAQGRFTVDVPANASKMVVVALDDSGERVGSVIVESSGEIGETTTAQDIDSETSLEAEVLLELVARGRSAETVDTIDLRKRIFADVAATVQEDVEASGESEVLIGVFADAVAASQETRVMVFTDHGLNLDAEELWTAKADAMADLEANLRTTSDAMTAYSSFFDATLDSEAELGVDARTAAEAETQASMAFRTTIQATLDGRLASEGLVDASSRTSGVLEAWTTARAASDLSTNGSLDAGASAQLELAGQTLRSDVRTASSIDACIDAFETFESTVLDAESGVIASMALDGPFIDIGSAVSTALDASADLESDVTTEVTSGASPSDVAATVTAAYDSFESDVDAVATIALFTDADLAAELMLTASAAFLVD